METVLRSVHGIELVNPVTVEQRYLDAKDARISELEEENERLKARVAELAEEVNDLKDTYCSLDD